MKIVFCCALVLAACFALLAAATAPDEKDKSPKPQYDDKGQLVRPGDYREWMFLSAGYGMNYSPAPGSHEMFTNVFVQRWAYEAFVTSGKWPEQTMFVIDERDAASTSAHQKTIFMDAPREPSSLEDISLARDPRRLQPIKHKQIRHCHQTWARHQPGKEKGAPR